MVATIIKTIRTLILVIIAKNSYHYKFNDWSDCTCSCLIFTLHKYRSYHSSCTRRMYQQAVPASTTKNHPVGWCLMLKSDDSQFPHICALVMIKSPYLVANYPRIVSGLVHPSDWCGLTRSLSHVNHWGYNPLTIRGMSHQVSIPRWAVWKKPHLSFIILVAL